MDFGHRLRDLGFFRNALKGEFLLAEGIDTDEDVGRRIALLLDFLGDHEESEEDEQKEVGSRRPGQALVEEAGDVTPALKEIDEGDEGSEGYEAVLAGLPDPFSPANRESFIFGDQLRTEYRTRRAFLVAHLRAHPDDGTALRALVAQLVPPLDQRREHLRSR